MTTLFDTMRIFQHTESEPLGATSIVDIEIDNRTDGIHIDLIVSNGKIKRYIVSHQNFREWLEDNDRLEWTKDDSDHNGSHVQESGTWGYVDYLNAHLDAAMVYEYLKAKALTTLQYVPE